MWKAKEINELKIAAIENFDDYEKSKYNLENLQRYKKKINTT